MRRVLPLVIVAALAGCSDKQAQQEGSSASPGTAQAAESLRLDARGVPQFRPGLWEVVSTDSTVPDKVEREHQCIGEAANEEMAKALTAKSDANCKVEKVVNAHAIKLKSDCVQNGVKLRTEIAMSGGETKYESRLKMGVVTPDGKTDGGEIVSKARWIGACPSDMAPGDSVEVN